MITDTELKVKGLAILTESLGPVEAEKFVSLILREPFDYTRWQRQLWRSATAQQLSSNAMQFRRLSRGRRHDAGVPRRSRRHG